jgi:hypothetical protein
MIKLSLCKRFKFKCVCVAPNRPSLVGLDQATCFLLTRGIVCERTLIAACSGLPTVGRCSLIVMGQVDSGEATAHLVADGWRVQRHRALKGLDAIL